MEKNVLAEKIIDALGGTSATARLCEINPASVCEWRHAGIPKPRMMFLRLAQPQIVTKIENELKK